MHYRDIKSYLTYMRFNRFDFGGNSIVSFAKTWSSANTLPFTDTMMVEFVRLHMAFSIGLSASKVITDFVKKSPTQILILKSHPVVRNTSHEYGDFSSDFINPKCALVLVECFIGFSYRHEYNQPSAVPTTYVFWLSPMIFVALQIDFFPYKPESWSVCMKISKSNRSMMVFSANTLFNWR